MCDWAVPRPGVFCNSGASKTTLLELLRVTGVWRAVSQPWRQRHHLPSASLLASVRPANLRSQGYNLHGRVPRKRNRLEWWNPEQPALTLP